MKKFTKVIALLALAAVISFPGIASATLLFDRGLPTANLNNDAGDNRSNVAWAFPSDANGSWLAGDDFKLGGTTSYNVDTISVWSMSSTGSLWFGSAGGTITNLGQAALSTKVTYSNGQSYQGYSGTFRDMYQLDFNVNRVLSGATTYQFFLDGPITGTTYAFLHSSNSALSGSRQDGADNLFLYANVFNGSVVEVGSMTSLGNGWDKASDGNVRVNGSPVPVPAAVWLLGTGLVGLFGVRRRFTKS
jgi:hypothetical protein